MKSQSIEKMALETNLRSSLEREELSLHYQAKRDLRKSLAPLETGAHGSGEASRWTAGRELEWVELRPELVIEVGYDHASAGRIRHGARFVRFRDDKDPRECRFEDLDEGA